MMASTVYLTNTGVSSFTVSTLTGSTLTTSTIYVNSLVTSSLNGSDIINVSSISTGSLIASTLISANLVSINGYLPPILIVSTLGIGTAAPISNLAVYGTAQPTVSIQNAATLSQLIAATSNAPAYSSWAVTNDGVIRASTSNLILQSGSSGGAIYINTSNNVGIGNSNATNLLTVGTTASPPGVGSVGTTSLVVYGNIGLYQNRLCFSSTPNDWNQSIYNNLQNLDGVGAPLDVNKYNATAGHWFRVGGAAIGSPPTTALFIGPSSQIGIGTTGVSASTPVRIYEATGSGPSATTGSIVLQHVSGQSSIVFPSNGNLGSDRGWISFYETTPTIVGPGLTYTQSLLFSCADDAAASGPDSVILIPKGNMGFQPTGGYTYFSGNVGIGTATTTYPLYVNGIGNITGGLVANGSTSLVASATGKVTLAGSNPSNQLTYSSASVNNPSVSIFTNGSINTSGNLYLVSDRRIKTNIQPIQDVLHIIQSLSFVSYDHIDARVQNCSVGLIAQQIKAILPDTITLISDFIPNVFQTPTFQRMESVVELTFLKPVDIVIGDTIKCIITNSNGNTTEHITQLSYLSDDTTQIRVEVWDDFDSTKQVLVYGKLINDFHHIDKQMIGLLGVAGIQQLDTLIQTQQKTIEQLNNELTSASLTLSSLQARILSLETNLNA